MELSQFLFQVAAALLMGVAIGVERQFNQHPAGLRTNALVCVGAALFVSLSRLVVHDSSPTHIAAQVVSGIGFLGGGVILREGMTVKGMNTAATLWCTAAVGTLSGSGHPLHALIGTLMILLVLLGLRPVSARIDARLRVAVNVETLYRLRAVCPATHEVAVRTIMLRYIDTLPKMVIHGITTQTAERPDQSVVVADIFSTEQNDQALEDLMSRLNVDPDVTSIRWEKVHNPDS